MLIGLAVCHLLAAFHKYEHNSVGYNQGAEFRGVKVTLKRFPYVIIGET